MATHVEELQAHLECVLAPLGFEVHPFLLGWYNEVVSKPFQLTSYSPDTLAFLIVSLPQAFENGFLPHAEELLSVCPVDEDPVKHIRDPLDSFMRSVFSNLQGHFSKNNLNHEMDVIQDFDMCPRTRRPLMLLQTVAHISGAAYYYQKSKLDINFVNSLEDKTYLEKIRMGVCLHPKYGGWFALRASLMFPSIREPDLPRKVPKDVLDSHEERYNCLVKFNCLDPSYRDSIPVPDKLKYSAEQMMYFSLAPGEKRIKYLKEILGFSRKDSIQS